MTIGSGDIKLVATQVMLDVPEGGGAPTTVIIPDGASNAIFPDISEIDRTGGRVNLRKLDVWVDTLNVDTYLGMNTIVASPPNDPNVAITLFSTGDMFDTRANAVSRIAAYLSVGPQLPSCYLFGNHIAGQTTLIVYQNSSTTPSIGDTWVLEKLQGLPGDYTQYVRIIAVSAAQMTFNDMGGAYSKWVLTLTLQSPLSVDFPGMDIQRSDYTRAQIALKTFLSSTVVANAARYYGVTPLVTPAATGTFVIKGQSIYTQLVPSAQVETPIASARTNQTSTAVIPGSSSVYQTTNCIFTTAQNLFIGGAVSPGSLSIVYQSATLTDNGGKLMVSGVQVGQIDYANGVLSLTTNTFGTGALSLGITYTPGAAVSGVNQSRGSPVTIATRALNYIWTFAAAPVPGSLQVSYMAQGRWYVLSDDGSGALRGTSSAYGAGNLNQSTATAVVTLGQLPDVGSSIIYQWAQPDAAQASGSPLMALSNAGNFYWPFNTAGQQTLSAAPTAITPGHLVVTWNDGTARTAVDDGKGSITGDATGSVNYASGTLRLSPKVLPALGTTVNVSITTANRQTANIGLASGAGNFGMTNIQPGSVQIVVGGQLSANTTSGVYYTWGAPALYSIFDDGAGNLLLRVNEASCPVGTVNYAAGTFSLAVHPTVTQPVAAQLAQWDNVYQPSYIQYIMVA